MTSRRALGWVLIGVAVAGVVLVADERDARVNAVRPSPSDRRKSRSLAHVSSEQLAATGVAFGGTGLVVALFTILQGGVPRKPWPPPDPTERLGGFRHRFDAPAKWSVLAGIFAYVVGSGMMGIVEGAGVGLVPIAFAATFALPALVVARVAQFFTGGTFDLYDGGLVRRVGRKSVAVPWETVAALRGMTQGTACEPAKRKPLWVSRFDGWPLRVSPSQKGVIDLAAAVYGKVLPLQIHRARAAIRRGEPVTCARLRVDAGGATRPDGDRLEWQRVGRIALERGRFLVEERGGRVWWRVNAERTPDVLLFAALAAELRFVGRAAMG